MKKCFGAFLPPAKRGENYQELEKRMLTDVISFCVGVVAIDYRPVMRLV